MDVRFWEQFVPKVVGMDVDTSPQIFLELEAKKSRRMFESLLFYG